MVFTVLKATNSILITLFALLTAASAKEISFNRDVKPILSDRCFHCHGPDAKNQKSDFRLDNEEVAFADLGGYFGIKPGDLKESELHWRIHSTESDDQMPPPDSNRSLSEAEKKILDQWIEQGAKYDSHWSFKPLPEAVPVPPAGEDWAKTEVDPFIHTEMSKKGLKPSAETSREKWIRRVTFDLTGLPPTLAEIDAFLADQSPKAYETVVDRLLDTDFYAERMTSEWLDVARYSDTYGYQVDRNREVWPWRDWVIRAFRQNMPYDQFITEQIAGDLLPNANSEQILATTFNRLHPQKVEGGSVPEEFRLEYVADRVHTFGTAFLGLTMECTRCHDHKYDPLTQKDYFSLSAYFSNIDEAGLYSYFTGSVPTPTLELPTDAQKSALAAAEKKVTELESKIAAAFESAKTTKPAETAVDLKNGLVAYLSFEENKGNQLVNLADTEKPAKTNANNKIVSGKIGNAIQLTGDDAVNLPKGVGNFSRDQPFSLALWLNAPTKLERAVVVRRSKAWTDAASRGYELLIEDGKLSVALIHFWPGNAIGIRSVADLPLKTWQHVTVTYDGSSRASGLKLFVDGQPAKTEVVRDHLTREIVGGGDDFVGLGQRMRDKGFKNGLVDEFQVFERQLSQLEAQKLAKPDSEPTPELLAEHHALLAVTDQLVELRKAREERSKAQKSIKEIMVMREMETPRPTYILDRGMYDSPADPVTSETPDVLPKYDAPETSNRLDLAKWLTNPNHPLTARVTVNRYWQLMFGRGLVSTSEDFGSQGQPPTHPELLDWLSRDFVANGWNVHRLLKQMALSATYRQSSDASPRAREIDPENLLLSHGPSYKLTAEMIRDNALAVSGLISPKIGGPSARPYDLAVSFKPIKHDKGENLYRRSVYTFWKRTAPAPVMMTLDASKRDVCRVKREETASPLQSLVLLNGPQFVEAARVAAENLLEKHPNDLGALAIEAFRLFTSRQPDAREAEILSLLVNEQKAEFAKTPDKAKTFLATGDRKPKADLDTAELAAATVLVSTLMNFDESITKR